MAKKKQRMCFHCDGMGNTCNTCGESESACECPDEDDDLVPCEECYGTGIAFADIVEKDLAPGDVKKWKADKAQDAKDRA